MTVADSGRWPVFPVEGWAQTGPTLHMWTQIVGKIRLALTPAVNHFWHVTLYVSARGLTTSAIPYRGELFEIEFDFLEHRLVFTTSWGPARSIPLSSRSVAEIYAEVMAALTGLGIDVRISSMPVEVPEPIRFELDRGHASYDALAAYALWRVLVRVDQVFKVFRGRFLGKCSPVHFFWGGFDLAVTRFSGRRAPMWVGARLNVNPHVMHASYSHEVSSAGFWPGNSSVGPLFYSYAVPEPPGFSQAATGGAYNQALGEFVLPYATVQASDRPDDTLLEFLQSTYAAAADLGHWDRVLLEQQPPCVCDTPTPIKE
jgi:hypothetical protein